MAANDTVREHLERYIFEVFGAEEGKRKLDELAKAEEAHSKTIAGLTKKAQKAAKEQAAAQKLVAKAATDSAKEQEKAAKKVAEAAKKQAEATKTTLKAAGVGLLALAALAAEASAKLETANGRIARSAKQAGVSQREMSAALEEADNRARRLGLGLLETRDQLGELLDVSGDTTTALADLALAQDIAATGDLDAKQAVEALTKARKGEVSELINLDGFTKTQIDSLLLITVEGDRAAAAMEILRKNYGGAAEELRGSEDAWKNIVEAGKDMLVVLGDTTKGIIGGWAEFFGVIDEGDDLLDQLGQDMRSLARDAAEFGEIATEIAKKGGIPGLLLGDESLADISARLAAARQGTADKPAPAGGAAVRPRGSGFAKLRGSGGSGRPEETIEELRDRLKKEQEKRDEALDIREAAAQAQFERDKERRRAQLEFFEEAKEKERDFADFQREIENKKVEEEEERLARRAAFDDKESARIAKSIDDNKKAGEKKTQDAKKDTEKAEEDAEKARNQAIQASIGAAGAIADSVIEGEVAKAVIKAAVETAAGFAALGTGQPGAALHFIAAAQYAAIGGIAAAKGGGGGGRGSIQKGGAAGKQGAAPTDDPARADRDRVGLQREEPGGNTTTILQINLNSTHPATPDQARQLFDTIEDERRNRA